MARTKYHVLLPDGVEDGPVTLTRPGIRLLEVKVDGGRVAVDTPEDARLVAGAFPGSVVDAPPAASDADATAAGATTTAGGGEPAGPTA